MSEHSPTATPIRFQPLERLDPLAESERQVGPIQIEDELERLREQARQEGLQAGLSEAAERISSLQQAFRQAEDQRAEQFARHLRRLEAEALELAFELADVILDQALERDPALTVAAVQRALSYLEQAEQVQVFVSAEDLETVRAHLQADSPRLRFAADPRLKRGDCRLESELGDVDATRRTAFAQLRQRLKEVQDERNR